MKHRTDELEGAHLDYAVALAQQRRANLDYQRGDGSRPIYVCYLLERNVSGFDNVDAYRPSTEWQHGGPIIERERIEVVPCKTGEWGVLTGPHTAVFGPTMLIAAMRAFVRSKLGEEVELP